MGFPNGWTNVTGNGNAERVKQTGNAVVVPMNQLIAEKILRNIEVKPEIRAVAL